MLLELPTQLFLYLVRCILMPMLIFFTDTIVAKICIAPHIL